MTQINFSVRFRATIAVVLGLSLIFGQPFTQSKNSSIEPTGDIHAHDPSMIHAGKFYYIFATGDEGGLSEGSVQIRRSSDMWEWEFSGTLFETMPTWITKEIGQVPNLWAPDVS